MRAADKRGGEGRMVGRASTPPLAQGPLERTLELLYQGRATVSLFDATREMARVVETPNACMASDAKNSRTDDRSTARPSAPRQNGVGPPPLSWNSHRLPDASSTSPSDTARPSP